MEKEWKQKNRMQKNLNPVVSNLDFVLLQNFMKCKK